MSYVPHDAKPVVAVINTLPERFASQGYVVLPRALPEALLDRHVAALAEFLLITGGDEATASPGGEHPEVTLRRRSYHWHSADILQLAMHPMITDTLATLIEQQPFLLQVGTLNQQRDGQRLHNLLTAGARQAHINVWISLKDVAVDQGPLWIAPGSHRSSRCLRERVLELRPHLKTELETLQEQGASLDVWRHIEAEIRYESDRLQQALIDSGEFPQLPVLLGRGDVVILHQDLLHGVLACPEPKRGRWCLLAQYGGISPRSRYFQPLE